MNLAIRTDLTNCDREPIHIPGHIQSHGFLFSLAPDTLNIERVSANFKDFTGLDIEDVLGKPMDALTSTIVPRSGSSLRDIIKLGLLTGNFEQLNPQKVNVDGLGEFSNRYVKNYKDDPAYTDVNVDIAQSNRGREHHTSENYEYSACCDTIFLNFSKAPKPCGLISKGYNGL